MDLVIPSLGLEGTGYTFGPGIFQREVLPPVWRCQCGFQLDAWFPCTVADTQPATTSAPARPAALCG